MEWMLMPFRRYADFRGRSRRMEFWMFQLLNIIVMAVIYALILGGGGLAMLTGGAALQGDAVTATQLEAMTPGPMFWLGVGLLCLWALATIVPSLAVTVRRLHDRNMTGWYLPGFIVAIIILSMIPILGPIVVLVLEIGWIVLMALPGTPGPNKWGADPLGQADPEVFA